MREGNQEKWPVEAGTSPGWGTAESIKKPDAFVHDKTLDGPVAAAVSTSSSITHQVTDSV